MKTKKWSSKWVISKDKIYNNVELIIDKGVIREIKPTRNPEFEYISPMLFDIHINGGYDSHFTALPSIDTLQDINMASFEQGTFYSLPTIITSSIENILEGIRAVKSYIADHPAKGILGIHIEGPFINPIKRGAHLANYIIKPTDSIIDKICNEGSDVIKMWTIAPEVFDQYTLDYIISKGINLSIGHTNANFGEATLAIDKGIKLVTHLYNAMSPLQHRMPGVVGAALSNEKTYNQIILDGLHCHQAAAQIALFGREERTILVSDALFLGRSKQRFVWEEFDAQLINGSYYNSEGNLAGSAISQLDAVKYTISNLKIDPIVALKMACINPYLALEIPSNKWDLYKGQHVPFVAFDKNLNFTYHLPF
ncbi:MAG TPA: N-acetylglucosamine-6-phosphate deacetylase [Saprospiraceae bacterium]|nr:N-acetylglucosamine-6-phosphate deacetylase [Saprospiraceae bacterium]